MRPARAVGILIAHGGHVIIIAAVIARRQRIALCEPARKRIVRLHIAAFVRFRNGASAGDLRGDVPVIVPLRQRGRLRFIRGCAHRQQNRQHQHAQNQTKQSLFHLFPSSVCPAHESPINFMDNITLHTNAFKCFLRFSKKGGGCLLLSLHVHHALRFRKHLFPVPLHATRYVGIERAHRGCRRCSADRQSDTHHCHSHPITSFFFAISMRRFASVYSVLAASSFCCFFAR